MVGSMVGLKEGFKVGFNDGLAVLDGTPEGSVV